MARLTASTKVTIAALLVSAGVIATGQLPRDFAALATPIRIKLPVPALGSTARIVTSWPAFARAEQGNAATAPGAARLQMPITQAATTRPRDRGAETRFAPASMVRPRDGPPGVSTAIAASLSIEAPEISDRSLESREPFPAAGAPIRLPTRKGSDLAPTSLAGSLKQRAPISGAVERLRVLFPIDQVAQPRGGAIALLSVLPPGATDSGASPELKREILARIASPPPSAQMPLKGTATKRDGGSIGKYHRTPNGLSFAVPARLNGADLGSVSLLIRDGENISVRLGDLLAALKPAIEPAVYERLSTSLAVDDYMTLNELRRAGISVRFDDRDNLLLGSR